MSSVNIYVIYSDYEVKYSNCDNGEMKLSGGLSSMNGRTEICYNNVWFGICADNYNNYNKVNTICRILGFSNKGNYFVYKCNIILIELLQVVLVQDTPVHFWTYLHYL